MLQQTPIKKNLFHLCFWILFFAGWLFFRYQDFSTPALAAKLTLLKVADLAAMVHISNYILVPYLLYKKKYFFFGLIYVVLIFSFSIFKMYLEGLLMHNSGAFNLSARFKERIYDNTIPHFLLVSTGVAFKLLLDHAKAQKQIGEIAKEKAETELHFLKSQINPHFLFNSINSVYFLIDKKNEDARNALHTFSEMLRYQLYECNGNKVSLQKELSFLKDYINVQQLRKNKNLEVHFDVTKNNTDVFIEPLLLIPFVENAFKHLSHFDDDRKDVINICIDMEENNFRFAVENTTNTHKIKAMPNESGIGLTNLKRRLELLYPGKHDLRIENDNDWFKANLSIKLR